MLKKLWIFIVFSLLIMFSGCGVEEAIRRNDDHYSKPGALDMPMNGYRDTYFFRFLGRYRISHQWPTTAEACEYRSLPTLGRTVDRYKGEVFSAPDIFETNGKTWQASNTGRAPMDFDRYVRSVKVMRGVYANISGMSQKVGEKENEEGLRPVCFGGWYTTSHILRLWLFKYDIVAWRGRLAERSPKGRWTQQSVAGNLWQVNETAEQDLKTRPLNGMGGPFQIWILSIGDTGYTIAMELGASQESLQFPEAHERFKATFRDLIESVKIEPLQP